MRDCTTPGCPGTNGYGICPCGCVDHSPEVFCETCENGYSASEMLWGANYDYCDDDEYFCDTQCIVNIQIWRITEDGENIFHYLENLAY